MARAGMWVIGAALMAGCGQEPAPVEPVRPVEVATSSAEVTALRERVAELERALAECRSAEPSGTETAALPDPVALPEGVTPPEPESPTRAPAERRDRSLLDSVLGDDETIVIPNPAEVLLGE